jgi:hypothetical protein
LLFAIGLAVAALLHERRWPHLDTLSACLLAGAFVLPIAGVELLTWAGKRVESLKVGGVFELALSAKGLDEPDERDSSSSADLADLADEIELRMRRAAEWTRLSDRPRSRRNLLAALTAQGLISPVDGAAIRAFFDDSMRERPAGEVAALQAVSRRLRIGILLRAAELNFERLGIIPQRPAAPRRAVKYHFAAQVGGRSVLVTVSIAKRTKSALAPVRAKDLAAVPGEHARWLVTPWSIELEETVPGVELVSVGQMTTRIRALRSG